MKGYKMIVGLGLLAAAGCMPAREEVSATQREEKAMASLKWSQSQDAVAEANKKVSQGFEKSAQEQVTEYGQALDTFLDAAVADKKLQAPEAKKLQHFQGVGQALANKWQGYEKPRTELKGYTDKLDAAVKHYNDGIAGRQLCVVSAHGAGGNTGLVSTVEDKFYSFTATDAQLDEHLGKDAVGKQVAAAIKANRLIRRTPTGTAGDRLKRLDAFYVHIPESQEANLVALARAAGGEHGERIGDRVERLAKSGETYVQSIAPAVDVAVDKGTYAFDVIKPKPKKE